MTKELNTFEYSPTVQKVSNLTARSIGIRAPNNHQRLKKSPTDLRSLDHLGEPDRSLLPGKMRVEGHADIADQQAPGR